LIESHYVTTDNAYVEATAAQVTPLMTAQIAARDAEIASAGSDLERAQADFDRRRALAASGAVSAEDLTPPAPGHCRFDGHTGAAVCR